MAELPKLAPGKRVILAGRTGSGKTTLAKFLIQNRSSQHWVILNPKHTAGYDTLPGAVKLNGWNEKKFSKAISENRFVDIRFNREEMSPEFMDYVVAFIHDNFDNIGVCCDELYYLHKAGQAGPGLIGLLTRGRERKQSFFGIMQRPKWVSLFCFSEADYICGMALNLESDRKRMVEATGNAVFKKSLDARIWRWYEVDSDRTQLWGAVPLT